MIIKHFHEELVITKEKNKDFKNSIECWICNDVKVRDHCHINGKYRGSAHRYCIINLKLNHKIAIVFYNLKNYDSHLLMQEPGKFNLKTNILPDELNNS